MSGVRPGMRQAIGLGLLIHVLLLIGPQGASGARKVEATRTVQRRVPSKAQAGAKAEPPARCVHIVRRGDSLARVAARYRTTRRSLIAVNPSFADRKLRVGQRLRISGCQMAAARHRQQPERPADRSIRQLLARVGPGRVLTWLFLAVPDSDRAAGTFQWPIEGPIASRFGRRHGGWHAGIDIQAEMGTPIRAAAGGTVIASGWERYYGQMIEIQHAGGFTTVYAHNLENLVEVGDEVEAGRVIGTVGMSGHASANHLHFEIRHDGVAYNPVHLLETRDARRLASAPPATLDDDDRE